MNALIRYLGFIVYLLTAVAGLSACSDGEIGVAATSPTVISGVASKGPLNGSTVCAYAITAGAKGAALGSCATNIVNGNYSIDIGAYTGPVLFEATGGTYTDEATGATVALASPLRSILSNATGSAANVAVTALTELAYQMANAVPGGLTGANIQAAIASVQTNFGVADIVNTLPVDALNVPPGASPAQKTYALALATISQYQKNQPAGTSVANSLQTIQACLAASTNCGTGATRVGVNLSEALNTFQAAHPAFSNMPSPVLNFGYQPTGNNPAASSDFPVNEPYATALIGKGIPEPFARFFAAAKRTGNCTGGTTCTYLITYPNGATRNVTWTATPNQQYTPTAGELASMALINENEPVYDGKFSATGLEHDSTTDAQINISFFVPITSISKSPSSMVQKLPLTRRAIPSNALCCGVGGYQGGGYEGIQIKLKDMQAKGHDVTAQTLELAEYAGKNLGAKALERWGSGLGSIHKVAGLLNDSAEAMKMYQETKAWLDELAALEDCAKNPTNSLTQTDPNYSANTVANLQATRARIEANGITRILNQVDETVFGLALDAAGGVAAGLSGLVTIPMKQGHIYIEETMKALSEQEMKMARDSVVSCVPACPTNLVATGVSENQINLSWSGSIDSISTVMTGYKVRRDGAYVGSPFVTSYSDTGLKPSTMYCYMVLAYNDYGSSPDCAQVCARTKGPPTVFATSPLNNATNVAVSSPITATFSEAMDATTISTGTFTISGVAGTVTYSGFTATFTPSADLEPSTTYTATITTGVKDVDGSAMKENYAWSFTTGGDIDGNLKFVLTGDRGQFTKGNADITWHLRSDSNSALKAYWPTGTITLDIAREGCDTVHVTKPISATNMDTPYDATDDGGGLDVYSSKSFVFPSTYWFWLHTDEWEQTFYCGQDKQPYTDRHYTMWLAVKPCEKMVLGSGFIPYTDPARLAGTLSCGTLTGVSMSGKLVVTWDFKDLE